MKFTINKEIFSAFPGLHIGVLHASSIDNQGESAEIASLLRAEEERIQGSYSTDLLSKEPKIASWRKAYSQFGAKPKKYKSSVESLYRRVIKGEGLSPINKVVDLYNYMSLKHMVPLGGDDIDRVKGGIELRLATGEESFTPLNAQETAHPKPREVVYADEKEVLCRRWNWRECDKSKMTEGTNNVAIVAEGLPPVSKQEIEKLLSELGELVQKYCGGENKAYVLSAEQPSMEL